MSTQRVVVVGASHAGAQLVASLRQEGWDGDVVLVGDEPFLPYHRPPMSKTYLAEQSPIEDLLIRGADFYETQRIEWRCGRVVAIDRTAKSVTFADGDTLSYAHLALCLGAAPRSLSLPGADLAGVHCLRTAKDVDAIRAAVGTASRVVIIGAGYIGLEMAASLRKLGRDVTVLEAADRVLARVTAPEVSAFYTRVHTEAGVDLRTGVQVEAIEGSDRVTGVRLADGELIEAEVVVVGVGVDPEVGLAEVAGLTVENGIVVDGQARTSDPAIVAAGDCVAYDDVTYGRVRLESVPSAGEQAKVAAATICGKAKTIRALPWFWSDQYDLKLQIAGLNAGYDEVVLRGTSHGRELACFYLRHGRLIAADCVNRPQEFVFAKRAITMGLEPDVAALADPARPLVELLQRSPAATGSG